MIKKIMQEMITSRKAIKYYNDTGHFTKKAQHQGRYEAYKAVLEMMGCNIEEIETYEDFTLYMKAQY